MSKHINLDLSIFELVKEYPELVDVMESLGFSDISKPVMLHSVGKIMTIPKGVKMKNIAIDEIVMKLEENGFTVHGYESLKKAKNDLKSEEQLKNQEIDEIKKQQETIGKLHTSEERTKLLKSYLKRLGSGEELESVRVDFVTNFKDVDASEIMKAEQELLADGTPLMEVQKLCDVHSALFHGNTREEKIANAEKAVDASVLREERAMKTKILVETIGHPLYTFTKENEELVTRINKVKRALESNEADQNILATIRDIAIHYAKKGDLLYPLLKVKYGISGPSDVMWTVDDEIRDEISSLAKVVKQEEEWCKRFEAVMKRAEEMIYKEANILFPNCALHFTQEEWIGIYHDGKDYANCFGINEKTWEDAENSEKSFQTSLLDNEVVMAGGHMTVEQLSALLNTIPLEITFVDSDNINRFFNEGPKDFKRPQMAIDREVFSCHPPKVEAKVRRIIDEFRAGTLDELPIWMEKNGKSMLVKYMAVRDKNKKYLGTLELVQNMDFAKEHFLSQKQKFGEEN